MIFFKFFNFSIDPLNPSFNILVEIAVGATALTKIPFGDNSRATDLVKDSKAALDAA